MVQVQDSAAAAAGHVEEGIESRFASRASVQQEIVGRSVNFQDSAPGMEEAEDLGIESRFVSRASVGQAAAGRSVNFQDDAPGRETRTLPPMQEPWVEGGWKVRSVTHVQENAESQRTFSSNRYPQTGQRRGPRRLLMELLVCCIVLTDCVSIGIRTVSSYRNTSSWKYSSERVEKWVENGHMIWDVVASILLTWETYQRHQLELFLREVGIAKSSAVESRLLKLDWYVTASTWIGVALSFNGVHFNLRPLRLFRVVYHLLQIPGRTPLLNGFETICNAGKDAGAGICILLGVSVATGAIALHVLVNAVNGRCGLAADVAMIPLTRCFLSDSAQSSCPKPFQCYAYADKQDQYQNIFGVGLMLTQGIALDGMDIQLHRTQQAAPELQGFFVPYFVCFFILATYVLANFVRCSIFHAYSRVFYKAAHLQRLSACWLAPFERQVSPANSEQAVNETSAGVQTVQISMQDFILRTVSSATFEIFSSLAIVVYVCLRIARHQDMRASEVTGFDWAEGVLTVWFLLENLLIGYAYGLAQRWLENAWRGVDALVSFISFASLCAIASKSESRAFRATSTLVTLRIFKVLIRDPLLNSVALRIVEGLEGMLGALATSVTALAAFALMSRALLGDAFEQAGSMGDDASRLSFRTVFWGGVSLLRLLAPDEVASLLLETSEASHNIGGLACSIAGVALMLVWFITSYLLLAPLLVAPFIHAFRVPVAPQGQQSFPACCVLCVIALWGLTVLCGAATAQKAVQDAVLVLQKTGKELWLARQSRSPAQIQPEPVSLSPEPEPLSPVSKSGHSLGSDGSPRLAWSDAKDDEGAGRVRENGGGASFSAHRRRVSGRDEAVAIAATAPLNRGSLRDGSRVLQLMRSGTGMSPRSNRGSVAWQGRRESVSSRILPHPKDRDGSGDAIVEFGGEAIVERPESASSLSTVNTGKGWGTRAFLMDGMEMDQGWMESISRPTTAQTEPDASAMDAASPVVGCQPQQSTGSPAAVHDAQPARDRNHPASGGAEPHNSPRPADSKLAAPLPASPFRAEPHSPMHAAPKRALSEIQERGKCFYCQQPVLNSQPRYKAPDGSYCHTACHERPAEPAEAVEPAADAAPTRPIIRKIKGQGTVEQDGLNLHLCVRQKDWDYLLHLIRKPTPLNAQNPKTGQTALHVACQLNRLEAVSLLLDGGASTEVPDHQGRTPVMAAACAGYFEPIRLLATKSRVNLYHKDNDNRMALQLVPFHSPFTRRSLETMCAWQLLSAAKKGKLQKVSAFLERGASTWLSDQHNRTALHLAAENGRVNVVRRLVEHRAYLDAEDVNRKTAVELAALRNHSDVVALLAAAGARVEEEMPVDEAEAFAKSQRLLLSRFQELRLHPRRAVRRLCESTRWRALVMVNSVAGYLPAAMYLLPHQSQYEAGNDVPLVAHVLAHASTGVLAFEILARICSYGLVLRPGAFFRRPLETLEFAIFFVAIAHPSFAVASCAKAVRLVRLVPLMGLRADSKAVLAGMPACVWPLLAVVVLVFFMFVSFSIAGNGLLGGLLMSCSDPAILYPQGRLECSGHAHGASNFLVPRAWERADSTLDDFGSSLRAVFVASTMEWSQALRDSMDVSEELKQSVVQARAEGAVYWSMSVLITGVISTGVIVAVAANSVRGYRDEMPDPAGAYTLLVARIQAYSRRLTRGGHGSKSSQSLLEPVGLRFFFEGTNILNLALIASFHEPAAEWYSLTYLAQNYACAGVSAIELLLYVSAYGLLRPFRALKHWCSLVALVGGVVQFFEVKETIVIVIVARTLRFLLWFSELGRDGVRPLAVATTAARLSLTRAIPACGLMLIALLIYAAIGHQAFALAKPGAVLVPGINFSSFQGSMWVLFHVMAGSRWHLLMDDCSQSPPTCTVTGQLGEGGDCGVEGFAVLFFVTFKMLMSILGGVLLGTVMDCVDQARHVEDDTIDIQHLISVRQQWLWVEGWTRKGVSIDQVSSIIENIPPPLGVSEEEEHAESGVAFASSKALPHSKLFNLAADPKRLRIQETVTMLGITAALRTKGRITKVFETVNHLFPDGRRTPITQLRQVPIVKYEDFILTLIHLAAPHLIPRDLRPLHDAILEHTGKVQASRQIIQFIRRRWEWRRNWADLLHHVHEQAQKKRLRDRLRREEQEEQQRREQERLEEVERMKRRREFEELYDLQGWVARTCNINLHNPLSRQQELDLQHRGYFARCIYYEIHIPAGCQQGSPLTPSVNEHVPGYPFHQRSASTFRTVAIPSIPPYPSIPPRRNYTATELCEVLNAVIALDLQCFLNTNDRRRTKGLEEAWEITRASLLRLEVDGAESNGFSLKIQWPGDVLGAQGLAAVNTAIDEIRRANVRVYCAQHSFYAMALEREDKLLPPIGNLAMYLGFFKGNKKHFSPVLGNQNSITLGGSNHLIDVAVPGGPTSSMTIEHQEDVLSLREFDGEPAKARRRAELIWEYGYKELRIPTASEAERLFLMNYSGGYGKKRAEVLAVQILQAIMRAKLARLSFTTQRVQGRKLGEKGMTRVLASQFLAKRERREASLALMLKIESGQASQQRATFSPHLTDDFTQPFPS